MPRHSTLLPPIAILLAFFVVILGTLVFLGLVSALVELVEVPMP